VNIQQSFYRGYFPSLLDPAILRTELPVIRLLTKDGSDCKAQNSEGLIPLFHAINEGSLDALRALVEEGGESLDVRDKYCTTAIDITK
jgi:ankyrin repeat protein